MAEATEATDETAGGPADGQVGPGTDPPEARTPSDRGKTVHGEAANAGHRVLAPDDAEVEAYLETALNAPGPGPEPARSPGDDSDDGTVVGARLREPVRPADRARVRELNVYSELLPHDTPWRRSSVAGRRAIILSGGPNSVYDDDAPKPDPAIWSGRCRSSASATGPS